MTREEYDTETEVCSISDDDTKSEQLEKYYIFEVASNRYIYSLETRIAELEEIANGKQELILELIKPKTCDGCKYDYKIDNIDSKTGYKCDDIFPDACYMCPRNMSDKYEPKDSK